MRKQIESFMGLGGIRLCMQSWKPDISDSVATVVLMHGGNNYCDLPATNRLAEYLVGQGYAVFSYDQRGYGRSEGKQMHLDCWEDARGDFSSFLHLVKALEPANKIFAFGISYGAIMVMDQAIVSPHILEGVIAGSFSTVPVKLPRAMLGLINIAGSLCPVKTMPAEPQPSFPSAREQLAGKTLWHDPICPRTMTFGNIKILFKRQKEIAGELPYITIPVLHLQGLLDEITLPDPTVAQKIGSRDYSYIEYQDTPHDILNGQKPEAVLKDIFDWLEERRKVQ